jgi:hypothetical protein
MRRSRKTLAGHEHDHTQATDTATPTEATTDIMGHGHLQSPAQHRATTEGTKEMTTAAEVIAFIANLNVAQLDALAHAIGRRKSELEDGALLRDIVADQRVNPQHAIPAAPTEWSAHRLATFDLEQEQKAEARRNGGGGVSHGRWG